MAVLKTLHAAGVKPMPIPSACETITVDVAVAIPVASKLALGDIVQLAPLPANCILLAADFDTAGGDLDSHATVPTLAVDLGLLTAAGTAVSAAAADGAKFLAASTVLQAPIAADTPTAVLRSKCRAVAPSPLPRMIAFVATAASALQGADVTVNARITYCAA